jgi:hypothetical protein
MRAHEPENSWLDTQEALSSLFVTKESVFLVDLGRKKLLRLSKRKLLDRIPVEAADKPLLLELWPKSPQRRELDYQEIPFTAKLEGNGWLLTSFSPKKLIIGRWRDISLSFPAFPALHAYDLDKGRWEHHCFPSFYAADFDDLIDMKEQASGEFERYLILLTLLEITEERPRRQPLFFSRRAVLFSDGRVRRCDLSPITPEMVDRFRPSLEFRYADLMSRVRAEQDRGILASLQGPGLFKTSEEIPFLCRRFGFRRIEKTIGGKLDEEDVPLSALDTVTEIFKQMDDPLPVAKRWLEGNPARQYIALNLLAGGIRPAKYELMPEDDDFGSIHLFEDPKPLFHAPAEIPADAVRRAVDVALETLKPIGNLSERDLPGPLADKVIRARAVVKAAATAAAAWKTESGLEFLRWLAGLELDSVDEAVADLIGKMKLYPLVDVLKSYLGHENPAVVEEAVYSLGLLDADCFENDVLPFLRSPEPFLPMRAASALEKHGTVKALAPLLYSLVLDLVESEADSSPSIELMQQQMAVGYVIGRIFHADFGSPPEHEKLAAGDLAVMVEYGPYYLLALLLLAFQRESDLAKPDRRIQMAAEVDRLLDFLRSLLLLDKEWDLLDFETLKVIARRERTTLALVEKILGLFLWSEFPDDIKYLLALSVAFAPDLIDPARTSPRLERIRILLRAVLERMARETDHRGISATLALVQLRLAPSREDEALEFFRAGRWRGWPRLMRVGERVLCDLPKDRRIVILERLLRTVKGSIKSIYLETLADIDARRAVELFERGHFKLTKVDEALLYGRVGDARGYDLVLSHATRLGDPRILEYLTKYGGQDAIDVLIKGRDEGRLTAKAANEAIRRIRAKGMK